MKEIFDPKKTKDLIGFKDEFNTLKNVFFTNKQHKILMLSGHKGLGKSTIINHLLHYYFDSENYNIEKRSILRSSKFHNLFIQNLFPNIIYLSGSNFRNIKIEDIRNLKNNLLKTSIINDIRFIILDDVETFNNNSLNAILKIIEDPGVNNFFILINNNTKKLIDTVKSRCLNIRIFLNETNRVKNISLLLERFKEKIIVDKDLVKISPGNFLRYNHFFFEKKINLNEDFLSNLKKIINIYKKEKDFFYRDLLLFLVDVYLQRKKTQSLIDDKTLIENRSYIIKSINNFFIYNLNQNTLLTSLENKFLNG